IVTGQRTSRIVVPAHIPNMSNLVAYVDGGSLGNPGPACIGVVIDDSAVVSRLTDSLGGGSIFGGTTANGVPERSAPSKIFQPKSPLGRLREISVVKRLNQLQET